MKLLLFSATFILIIILSCTKDNPNGFRACDDYFYYSSGKKNYVGDVVNSVWIEYVNDSIGVGDASTILSKFDFLDLEIFFKDHGSINYISLNTQCNCVEYQEILKTLNKDPEIESATPVFNNRFVLLNDVLLESEDNIDEEHMVSFCTKLGLVLREKTKYGTFVFEISESASVTGFEGFEISNIIYESGKVKYAHPNFIFPISKDV